MELDPSWPPEFPTMKKTNNSIATISLLEEMAVSTGYSKDSGTKQYPSYSIEVLYSRTASSGAEDFSIITTVGLKWYISQVWRHSDTLDDR